MYKIVDGIDYLSDDMFIKYLDISKASCSEVMSMLYLAEGRRYCDSE